MTVTIKGVAGFAGFNFSLIRLCTYDEPVIDLDKLTYAGNPANFASTSGGARRFFVQAEICDSALIHSSQAGLVFLKSKCFFYV